jgi:hypothetical protein
MPKLKKKQSDNADADGMITLVWCGNPNGAPRRIWFAEGETLDLPDADEQVAGFSIDTAKGKVLLKTFSGYYKEKL